MLVRVSLGIDDHELRGRVLSALPFVEALVVGRGTREDLVRRLPERTTDLVLVDVDDIAALQPIAELVQDHPDRPQLVVLTASDHAEVNAQAVAMGAVAVIDLALSGELLESALSAVVQRRRQEQLAGSVVLARANRRTLPRFVTASDRMERVLATAQRVARADSPVLILGETGVGKERIAEVIHRASPRAEGPFVPVNCAAIPAELFESELFGHERGAFTGAQRSRRGLFELAHEGTLFLDEVGEVPEVMQSKLLRALQDHCVRPLGASKSIELDVRVVAATNRDLLQEMEVGRFRRDLYYRLCVVELEIPPLRDRREDVEGLVPVLVDHFAARLGRGGMTVAPRAMEAIMGYAWPGNVRELANVLERAVLLSNGASIELGDLPPILQAHDSLDHPQLAPETPAAAERLDEVVRLPEAWSGQSWKVVREGILEAGERAYLQATLTAAQGRVGEAAKRAGISARALFNKMKRHGLRKEDYR
ncbi:MAG: sigma-54 dependent transcriptional regulator [Nannocystaceae bacterium]|nr:sigma-54 dependent transcriptional regulator [bacterium]